MKTLGLFVKYPLAGQVKTRLAGEIGDDNACRLYTAFVADLTERFRSYPSGRCLGYAPDSEAARCYFEQLACTEFSVWPQPASGLGDRMLAFFSDHLPSQDDRAVLIGSDSPTLPIEAVDAAFRQLDDSDLVLGPAADGGYYLIGMRHPVRDVFQGISWSEPSVLRATVEQIQSRQLRLTLLPVWYDVDSGTDLEMLRGHLAAAHAIGADWHAPASWQVIQELDESRSRMKP